MMLFGPLVIGMTHMIPGPILLALSGVVCFMAFIIVAFSGKILMKFGLLIIPSCVHRARENFWLPTELQARFSS